MDELLEKITDMEQRYLRLKAVQEERLKRKQELEQECIEKGFNPKTIQDEVAKLEEQKTLISKQLEEKLSLFEALLAEYDDKA